jgi:flagellin-like hook-associated protein FlgL
MGLRIGSSGAQLTLLNNNAQANRLTNQATERLATGLRINRASDDPAGLIGAEQLRGDLVKISAEQKVVNARQRHADIQQSGRQIASGVLYDLRGLFVEAADSTISAEQRAAIQLQVDSSLDSLDRLGETTGFALSESIEALRAGGSASASDGEPAAGVELLEQQLSSVNLASAAAGAYEKYTLDVDRQLAEARAVATASSLSQIADADYARESSNLVAGQILTEVSLKTMVLSQQIRADQIRSLFALL